MINASSTLLATAPTAFSLSLDGYFYDGRPTTVVKAGKLAKVAIITGNLISEHFEHSWFLMLKLRHQFGRRNIERSKDLHARCTG